MKALLDTKKRERNYSFERSTMRRTVFLAAGGLVCVLGVNAQQHKIDTQKSTLTIHVGKTGVFSGLGHEHEVRALIHSGTADTGPHPAVEVHVDVRALRVIGKDEPEKDRAEVQKTMLGPEVLDSERHQELARGCDISFFLRFLGIPGWERLPRFTDLEQLSQAPVEAFDGSKKIRSPGGSLTPSSPPAKHDGHQVRRASAFFGLTPKSGGPDTKPEERVARGALTSGGYSWEVGPT
jgi:hypothetical protein